MSEQVVVYVVLQGMWYDEERIEGIYATRALADAREAQGPTQFFEYVDVQEWTVQGSAPVPAAGA